MRIRSWLTGMVLLVCAVACFPGVGRGKTAKTKPTVEAETEFRTSDRCVACHNGMKTSGGEDISIGFQWRASLMANSARDPYWQGSVRRESMDHPESQAAIEDECSTCHMPVQHLADKSGGKKTEVFAHLPLTSSEVGKRAATDGVSCAVCHQIQDINLGKEETFNGNVVVAGMEKKDGRAEYGPFAVDAGHTRVMQTSTGGFVPEQGAHIRDSALCGTCHTLYTKALGPGGTQVGVLAEQMPYKEWLHSDYTKKETCQSCHMPEVAEAVPVTALFGEKRVRMHRHVFVGGNFLMERVLNEHRGDLGVDALPQELNDAVDRTIEFLKTKAARVTLGTVEATGEGLSFEVKVENLTGHKLPTAYPSRRAWLRVAVTDRDGRAVFESGALNPDGSIVGNDNDADPLRFEPHYREITRADEVEIFEPILKDSEGRVTTGLLSAVGYAKDNRLLPSGFDKVTADKDVQVVGDAAGDPGFTDSGSLVRYRVGTGGAVGPFHVVAELWYQPIGFRWAHNLAPYKAMEAERMVTYYEHGAKHSGMVLGRAEATR